MQGRKKVWKSGGASSNVVGIILPKTGVAGNPGEDRPVMYLLFKGTYFNKGT